MKNSIKTVATVQSQKPVPAHIRPIYTRVGITVPKYFSVQDRAYSILNHPLVIEALDIFVEKMPITPADPAEFKIHSLIGMPVIPLNSLVIDDTLQRSLDIDNIVKIISTFDPALVSAVKVAEKMFDDDDTVYDEGFYLNYDSQHTVVAVWIIIHHLYGEDAANDTLFPALINEKVTRGELREHFLLHNDPKRKYYKPCNPQELHEQYVMMKRVDKSNDKMARDHEEVQSLFEDFGVAFISAKSSKYRDIKANSTSRINEFMQYNSEVQRLFLVYHDKRVELGNKTGMQPKEQVVMFHIIDKLCNQNEGITDEVIQDLTTLFNELWKNSYVPNGPWSSFWHKVKFWYEVQHRSYDYKPEAPQAYNYIKQVVWSDKSIMSNYPSLKELKL